MFYYTLCNYVFYFWELVSLSVHLDLFIYFFVMYFVSSRQCSNEHSSSGICNYRLRLLALDTYKHSYICDGYDNCN